MTDRTVNIVDILLEAKALLAEGWCQGRDKTQMRRLVGMPRVSVVESDDVSQIVCTDLVQTELFDQYCIRGALIEAAVRCGLTSNVARHDVFHSLAVVWTNHFGIDPVSWNDAPNRTQTNVLTAMDHVIRSVKDMA